MPYTSPEREAEKDCIYFLYLNIRVYIVPCGLGALPVHDDIRLDYHFLFDTSLGNRPSNLSATVHVRHKRDPSKA